MHAGKFYFVFRSMAIGIAAAVGGLLLEILGVGIARQAHRSHALP